MTEAIRAQVEAALASVHDPCSLAAQVPLSIGELGLVRGWDLTDDGALEVRICVTTQACTMLGHIVRGIEESTGRIAGVRDVRVVVEPDVLWGEDMMSADGQRKLVEQRRRARDLTGVRPRQWKERPAQRRRPEAAGRVAAGRQTAETDGREIISMVPGLREEPGAAG